MGTTGKALTFSLLSLPKRFSFRSSFCVSFPLNLRPPPSGEPLCTTTVAPETVADEKILEDTKHSILLERLRLRHLKGSVKVTPQATPVGSSSNVKKSRTGEGEGSKKKKGGEMVSSFWELGLSEGVMGALNEMGISVPTEIQCIGIPAVLEGKSVVLGSHTGSGKTLAYLLPLVQLLRRDESLHGMLMKPRHPRAIVLCPTRELCEQVFRMAKSSSHHARFRSTMVSGGGRLRPQEDSLNSPIDMIVGTPGRVLQHIEAGNMVYGDIRYLVLEPSLAKGNRVMVFCNTLNSSRAVDHFLNENQISTVNYHGEVPAEQRVENLQKFKSDDGDCPTLVCTDLAARGLDLDVDHVIMFDFPLNSIDYLHRTGRTARMGAKGKVTSLVAKKDLMLATQIEEAIMKNASLESLSVDSVKRDIARSRINVQKERNEKMVKVSNSKNKAKAASGKKSDSRGKAIFMKSPVRKSGNAPTVSKPKMMASKVSKTSKSAGSSSSKGTRSAGTKQSGSRNSGVLRSSRKLNVVGFRGRSSVKVA